MGKAQKTNHRRRFQHILNTSKKSNRKSGGGKQQRRRKSTKNLRDSKRSRRRSIRNTKNRGGTIVDTLRRCFGPLCSSNDAVVAPVATTGAQSDPQIIGKGGFGCVYQPSLECSDVTINYDDMVSKVLTDTDANNEFKEYKMIHRIDPRNKYHLGTPIKCKPRNTSYNITALQKCRKLKSQPIKNLSLLIMKNGGKNIKDYTTEISKIKPLSEAVTELKNVLFSLSNLFQGLQLFQQYNIIHGDLKSQNVVYNPNSQKSYFIDFGMMMMKKRVYGMGWDYISSSNLKIKALIGNLNSPFESSLYDYVEFKKYVNGRKFIFDKIKNKEVIKYYMSTKLPEDEKWLNDEFRIYYTTYFEKLNETLQQLSSSSEEREQKIKIAFDIFKENFTSTYDIYGMGTMFWHLLYISEILLNSYKDDAASLSKSAEYKSLEFIKDELRKLARRMCHPDNSQRIKIEQLITEYNEFLTLLVNPDRQRRQLPISTAAQLPISTEALDRHRQLPVKSDRQRRQLPTISTAEAVRKDGEYIHQYIRKLEKMKINNPEEALNELKNVLFSLKEILQKLKKIHRDGYTLVTPSYSLNIKYNSTTQKSFFDNEDMQQIIIDDDAYYLSYPLEHNIFLGDYTTFENFLISSIDEKQEFVSEIFNPEKLKTPSHPPTTKISLNKIKQYLIVFIITLDKNNQEWFTTEIINYYTTGLQELKSKSLDEKMLFFKNTKLTFEIYGMSEVFWELLKFAKSFTPQPDFTDELQSIARSMCHPDNSKRIQFDSLIQVYDDFLKSIDLERYGKMQTSIEDVDLHF